MSMTGTSLHDFARTMAGYEIYAKAAKPKGAAVVMITAHWKYCHRRALAYPFAAAKGIPCSTNSCALVLCSCACFC